MAKYVKVREVCVRLQLDESTLRSFAEGGVGDDSSPDIRRRRGRLGSDDAERVRVISVLMHEMDVNLAGAEVILHMREELISMRRQFDEVVETLVKELRKQVSGS